MSITGSSSPQWLGFEDGSPTETAPIEEGAESTGPSSPSGEHGDTVAKEHGSGDAEILMKPHRDQP